MMTVWCNIVTYDQYNIVIGRNEQNGMKLTIKAAISHQEFNEAITLKWIDMILVPA